MASRIAAFTALVLLGCSHSSTPPAAPPAQPEPGSTSSVASAPAPAGDAGAAAASPAPAIAPTKPAAADESGTPRERLMRSHFRETAALRAAVVKGSLSEAVAPAQALEKLEGLGKVQPSWKPSLDALGSAARRVAASPDIPEAAAATVDIGVACGSCHRTGGGPNVAAEPPPASDGTLPSRMKQHVWATERMWEALYVPSDASWKAGVDALASDPFPKPILDRGGVHARSAAARFRQLASTAGAKAKTEERAKLYASLLETCSACHMATRDAR